MMCRPLVIGLILVGCLLPVRDATALEDAEVRRAIHRMQQFLLEEQEDNGAWTQSFDDTSRHRGGETALVTLALLKSGIHGQDPRIQQALAHLRQIEMRSTYAIALRAHVWAALPEEYRPDLRQDASWLADGHRQGRFGYTQQAHRFDHSCTQYGVLGLWEAAKRDLSPASGFWQEATTHFVNVQNEDGGWGYQPGRRSHGSMTTAGLTVLYIGLQQLERSQSQPSARLQQAIDDGLAWLKNRFKPDANPNGGRYYHYYLYGIERIALASGVRFLNGHDWFESGAEHLLSQLRHDGSIGGDYVDTAFSLLFLARGRVPVWINKLTLPNHAWNRRPNDLHFLTRYLSQHREQELNWQRAPIGTEPRQWLTAPVLYLSSDGPLELSEGRRQHLKRYLDLGGLLVANPEGPKGGSAGSIRRLARQLYPDRAFEAAGPNHPLTDAIVDAPEGRHVRTLNNGARDLILLLPRDWGIHFQRDRKAQRKRRDLWDVAVNLFGLATERGRIGGRLEHPLPARDQQRDAEGELVLARARHQGDWNPEPAASEPLQDFLFNRAGLALNVQTVPLAEIDQAQAPLVHLAGTGSIHLTDQQLEAIQRYTADGGTLLVETVGGRGGFALDIERQLTEHTDRAAERLGRNAPLLTGEAHRAAFDCRALPYRPWTVAQTGARGRPRLTAMKRDGRPAILFSAEDLSLGWLGVPRWGVNGYQPEAARKLMTNLLLQARAQQLRQ